MKTSFSVGKYIIFHRAWAEHYETEKLPRLNANGRDKTLPADTREFLLSKFTVMGILT